MGVSLKGSGDYKPLNVEGFLPADDEATPQVVYITHKVTETSVHFITSFTKLTSVKVDATYFSVPGSLLLPVVQARRIVD